MGMRSTQNYNDKANKPINSENSRAPRKITEMITIYPRIALGLVLQSVYDSLCLHDPFALIQLQSLLLMSSTISLITKLSCRKIMAFR